MADFIPFPRFETGGFVDRNGALSTEFIDFLRNLAASTSDAATATALSALLARVSALEADSDPLRLFGTRGVQVFGSEESGFEIRGPLLPTARATRTVVIREEADIGEPWPQQRRQTAGITAAEVAARVAYGA